MASNCFVPNFRAVQINVGGDFLRATACNASRVLDVVEVSVRSSVWHTLKPCQNGAS